FIFFSIMAYSWYHCLHADPGYISPGSEDEEEIFASIENGMMDARHYCLTCLIKKPLRSKHDRLTNRCIGRFDHYCVWMNMPIGYKNHRYFMIFCYSHVMCQFLLTYSGFKC